MTRHPDGPGDSPGFLLWHATLRWQRAMTTALAPLGLTHVQFVLLACAWWLDESGRAPNQQAIAAQAGTDVKMTSQVLRTLEGKGLLERRVDPADTRARIVSPTARGIAVARAAITAVEDADDAYFAAVNTPTLVATLTRLAHPPQ